jgi:hypothetical protein
VLGDIGRVDRGEDGWIRGLGLGSDAVGGLAGGSQGDQLDGEARAARGVAVLGVGQDSDGFAGGVGGEGEGEGEPGFGSQRLEDGCELDGV